MLASQESKANKTDKSFGLGPAKFPGDPKKREVKDKSYNWITRCMDRLEMKGYVEEIHSFQHFDQYSKSFTFKIIAITYWGRRYMELRFSYPVPVFPNYLFSLLSESHQVVGQSPMKLDSIQQLSSDVWAWCTEAWTLMVSVLQFWTKEETIKDGEIFKGWIHLVSALAEYVMGTINPHPEPGYKVT